MRTDSQTDGIGKSDLIGLSFTLARSYRQETRKILGRNRVILHGTSSSTVPIAQIATPSQLDGRV